MGEEEKLFCGDSNHRPSACRALSLSIREWLRCSKGAEFGSYHTARRLVKGKEKLKRVSCTQKNGLELVHPERVRPGEAQNGGLGEKLHRHRPQIEKVGTDGSQRGNQRLPWQGTAGSQTLKLTVPNLGTRGYYCKELPVPRS